MVEYWTEADCPIYSVVKASSQIGIKHPEDVPWKYYRVVKYEFCWYRPSTWRKQIARCTCNAKLLPFKRYKFNFSSGKEINFGFSQCQRCRIVHWK